MAKRTLVLGASSNPERYSYKAIERLVETGNEVIAFAPRAGAVGNVVFETSWNPNCAIDTITLYINPSRQEAYYQAILELKPRRVLFNPGTENPDFYPLLIQAGIQVEEACTLVLLAMNQYDSLH
jgi:predicted CoA-binding protein